MDKTNGAAPHDHAAALTTGDVTSFKDLGAEVCLSTDGVGDLWLVDRTTSGAGSPTISHIS